MSSSSDSCARRLADAVERTWHQAYGPDRRAVPVSVVAALALAGCDGDERISDVVETESAFAEFIPQVWARFVNSRPDLVVPAWPLVEPWHSTSPLDRASVCAAHLVARAAVHAGLLDVAAPDARYTVDLLGPVVAALRSGGARQARGQFGTPSDLADVLATVTTPAEGARVVDPAAGAGGLLRAAAQAMRRSGRDPATVAWFAVDLDPVAVACLACNAVLWDLGPHVIVGVGDGIADDWMDRAMAQRNECLGLARTIRSIKSLLSLVRSNREQ